MNAVVPKSSKHLRGAILRDVSRSFYLSIRLLPAPVRDPIALAYLLARATDTIADTTEIGTALRLERLRELTGLIQGEAPPDAVQSLRAFAALQKNEAERALIERLPECLEWLSALSEDDREDVRAVLGRINEGQTLDVTRFQNPAQVVALATTDDLERYTFLVAGCVGEFWTRICWRKLARFTSETREMMLQWGVAYGEALQLVNILRDAGADLRMGRCYLPEDELEVVGVKPMDLRWNAARTEPVLRAWLEHAEEGI
ncbi:MAG: squalene/phytoene synthase family protein [Chthoniobacterales bacterium]